MKNILLVFTGGTIGSKAHQGVIDTDSDAGFKLINLFRERFEGQGQVNFDILCPVQLLSENLHPDAWRSIIGSILSKNLNDYDGIIVTHGTDTLAFTAAVLSVYFNDLKVPLLLVSSDLPLDDPHANGVANFSCAVAFILKRVAIGCFVSYQNPGQVMQVHLASRLSSCLPLSSNFISVQSRPFMQFVEGRFELIEALDDVDLCPVRFKAEFARLLLIRPYPGLDYSHFDLQGVEVVLHDLYHSGTACVSAQWGQSHQLIHFAQRCQSQSVPLYLAPAMKTPNAYCSTRALMDSGVQMIWNTSLEAAYAKLILAYGNALSPTDIAALISTNVAHELLASLGQ